jgi:predicted DNA-binding transcriptional regulator AlpA
MSGSGMCLVYTLAEVAEMFGKDPRTIVRWCQGGKFPAPLHFPGRTVFDRAAVDAWWESKQKGAG